MDRTALAATARESVEIEETARAEPIPEQALPTLGTRSNFKATQRLVERNQIRRIPGLRQDGQIPDVESCMRTLLAKAAETAYARRTVDLVKRLDSHGS